jgi:glycosyltransferase involved in cell wall biosynthesis
VAHIGRLARDQLRGLLRRSDVYVSAARSDGSSLSLLEALSVGLPVVVSDLDGNREWVDSDTIGRLFPVGDAESLGRALLEVTRRSDDAAGRAARREVVLARGDWDRNRLVFLGAVDRALGAG